MANFSHGGINTFTPEQQAFLRALVASHNNVASQVNASPVGVTPPPQPHAKLSVVAGGGITDVQITDNSDSYRDKQHCFEYTFDNWQTVQAKDLGTSQNWRGSLGVGNLQIRSKARYSTSAYSTPIYHSSVDTGAGAEPPMQSGQNLDATSQPFMGVNIPKRQ